MKNLGVSGTSTSTSGGGVAAINFGSIENCSSGVIVTATGSNNVYVGGVVDQNHGSVTNCYNTGNITVTGNNNGVYVAASSLRTTAAAELQTATISVPSPSPTAAAAMSVALWVRTMMAASQTAIILAPTQKMMEPEPPNSSTLAKSRICLAKPGDRI